MGEEVTRNYLMVAAVIKDGLIPLPDPDTKISKNNTLIFIGSKKVIEELEESLS